MDRDTEDSAVAPSEEWGIQADTTAGGDDRAVADPKEQPDEQIKKFIERWTTKIKNAKKRHDKVFKKMRECQQLAKDGHDKEWGDEKFTTPIILRYINTAVAQLYAKNPTAYAQRKKRRLNTVWDGTQEMLQETQAAIQSWQQAQQAVQQAAMQGGQVPPPPPLDPQYVAVAQDIEKVKQYDTMVDGIADTLTILTQHFIDDPAAQYKQQFKMLVRRTKVNGVGYTRLAYERILEKDPEISVKIDTITEQMETIRRLLAEKSRDEIDDDSADMEELRTTLRSLQDQEQTIVREGPLFVFPKSTNIIIDPECYHLKTLAGAGWYAEEFEKTPEQIEEQWSADVRGQYTQYKPQTTDGPLSTTADGDPSEQPGKVWRVMDRNTGQEFTICEGFPFYLEPPAPPKIQLARFWDLFPLVFNEVEDDHDIYPPSDVWITRHIQNEYNRTREGLREHRQQNRPAYISPKGSFDEGDLDKLQSHASGEIITMNQLAPGDKVADKLQPKPVMQIDPKQYDVTELWNDMLRSTGSQQADLGPTTSSTATESAIAEQSRGQTQADAVDDIDDMLGLLFQATGEVLLREVSPDIVTAIVGPGAVWPTMPQTREQIIEELILSVKGGSSGRPNVASQLQKLQTAMPIVIQIPGFPIKPLVTKYVDLLDIDADLDLDDQTIEGLPSIVALNGMMQRMAQAGAQAALPGNNAPEQQGQQGANNGQQPAGAQQGPAIPPTHYDHQGNPIR